MLFKKKNLDSSIRSSVTQGKSHVSARRRWLLRHSRRIVAVVIFVVLLVPVLLLAKSLYIYKAVVQRHSGVSSKALKEKKGEFDSQSEAEGRINILLLGVGDASHAGSTLTDSIMVASIDPETKDVAMLSLPRDLYVPIPKNGKDKINAVHALGEAQKSNQGPNLAKEVVGDILDIPIHNYIRVDFTGFKKAVDTLGGVTVNVATPLSDLEYPCDKDARRSCGFSLQAGQQALDGDMALKYVRCRKGNCGNDFGRASRQQEVILAMRQQALQLSTLANPGKLVGMLDVIGSHARTDLSGAELERLAKLLKDVAIKNTRSKVVDDEVEKLVQVANIAGASVVIPVEGEGRFEQIQDFTHQLFFDRHLVEENISVTIIDASSKPQAVDAIAQRLRGYRYNIIQRRGEKSQQESIIIDGTSKKAKYTRRYLEKRFGLSAREDKSRGEGITLVVGNDLVTKIGDK